MPRALWWLLACSRTASAVLMTTATRAATTNDWGAVPKLLKRREVSAVFVEDAASLIDGSGWATALEGAAEVVVECDCCVEDAQCHTRRGVLAGRRVLRITSGAGLRAARPAV